MTDLDDIVFSPDDDKRKQAFEHTDDLSLEHLKELATDPVLDIASKGTAELQKHPDAPPLKVYFELERDARDTVVSPFYPRVSFEFPPLNTSGWHFEVDLMINEMYPGEYALGFATPVNEDVPFLFEKGQIFPSLEDANPCFFEIVEFIDPDYRWQGS